MVNTRQVLVVLRRKKGEEISQVLFRIQIITSMERWVHCFFIINRVAIPWTSSKNHLRAGMSVFNFLFNPKILLRSKSKYIAASFAQQILQRSACWHEMAWHKLQQSNGASYRTNGIVGNLKEFIHRHLRLAYEVLRLRNPSILQETITNLHKSLTTTKIHTFVRDIRALILQIATRLANYPLLETSAKLLHYWR